METRHPQRVSAPLWDRPLPDVEDGSWTELDGVVWLRGTWDHESAPELDRLRAALDGRGDTTRLDFRFVAFMGVETLDTLRRWPHVTLTHLPTPLDRVVSLLDAWDLDGPLEAVDQATGILMVRDGLNAGEALALLERAARRLHVPVRDIATRVVETRVHPDDLD